MATDAFRKLGNLARPKRSLNPEPLTSPADGGPRRFTTGSFKRFRGHSHQCRLLDSGESLSALWIARYLPAGMSANESLESVGALAASANDPFDPPRYSCGDTGLVERRVNLRIVFGKHVSIIIQHPGVPRSAFGLVKSRAAPVPFATQLSSSLDLCWIGLEHHH
jgi:hypothetical protein